MFHFPVSKRASNIEYAIRDITIPADKLKKAGKKIINLNIGDPLAYPNFYTPKHMINAFSNALKNQNNGYSSSYGVYELRKEIAFDESNKNNGGWNCKPEDVYICHGVTEALQILFASFLNKRDKVLVPGPHYPPYMAYPQLFGAKSVEYKLDMKNNWDIDLHDLESKIDDKVRLLVIINPNNPTGGIVNKNQLTKIIEILEKWPRCAIISDEIYDLINFQNNHYSTASLSKNIPVITLNGVSKGYYAPGWRIGYMAWHDPDKRLKLVRDGAERLLRSRLCASTPAQMGYIAGLKNNKSWIYKYRNALIKQRDYCIHRIANISGLDANIPKGSFYIFIRLTDDRWKNKDKDFVLSLLNSKHILVVHGSGFSQFNGRGHFRLVFLPSIEVLEIAFDRIANFLNDI